MIFGKERVTRISREEIEKQKGLIENYVAKEDKGILSEIFVIIEQLTDNPDHQIVFLSELHSIVIKKPFANRDRLIEFKSELLKSKERRDFLGKLKWAGIGVLLGGVLRDVLGYIVGRRKQETPKLETTPSPTPSPTETPTPSPTPPPTGTPTPTATPTSTPEATPTPDFKKLEEEIISKYFPTLKQILELPENKGAYVDWGSVKRYQMGPEEYGVFFLVYGLNKIPCNLFAECKDYKNGKVLTKPKSSNREWFQSVPEFDDSRAHIKGNEIIVEEPNKPITLYYIFESRLSDRQVNALTEEEIKEFLNKIEELEKLQNAK